MEQPPEITETKPWPVDVEALQKGDTITVEELEKITGLRRYDRRFSLEVMRIKASIIDTAKAQGRELVISNVKGALHVHLDHEATEYLGERIAKNLRDYVSNIRSLKTRVDVSMLTSDQRNAHDQRLAREMMRAQAAGLTKRLPKLLRSEDQAG